MCDSVFTRKSPGIFRGFFVMCLRTIFEPLAIIAGTKLISIPYPFRRPALQA